MLAPFTLEPGLTDQAKDTNTSMDTVTTSYPHTTILADIRSLRTALNTSLDQLEAIRVQYLTKKTWYTDRIAELEDLVEDSVEDDDEMVLEDAPVAVEYPHTHIQANIASLRGKLVASNSDRRQERLELLAAIERDYVAKRAWFTSVRNGVAAEYPHTDIQDNLMALTASLEDSTSPDGLARLALVREIEREYMIKRDWFSTLAS